MSDVQLLYNTGHSPGQFRQDKKTCEIIDNSEYVEKKLKKYCHFIPRSTKTL